LRRRREGVLLFAGYRKFFRDVLGGDTHVDLVERVPETVHDHCVHEFPVAHHGASAGFGQRVRGKAHIFLTAGNHNFRVTTLDRLGGKGHSSQAASAHLIDGHGRNSVRQSGFDDRLAGWILAGGSGEDLAKYHIIDLIRLDAGLLDQSFDDGCSKRAGRDRREGSIEAADCSAAGCDYDNFFVHDLN
jgi:hypothetical protein